MAEKKVQLSALDKEAIKEAIRQKLAQKKATSGGLVFEEIETGEIQDVQSFDN